MLDLYSDSMRWPGLNTFAHRGMFSWYYDLGLHVQMAISVDHLPKRAEVRQYVPVKKHHGDLCISYQQMILEYTNTMWAPWYNILQYHSMVLQVFNGLIMCFHRSVFDQYAELCLGNLLSSNSLSKGCFGWFCFRLIHRHIRMLIFHTI